MRRWRLSWVITALGAAALGVHGGCSNSPAAQAAAAAKPEPAAVTAPPPHDELLTDQARVLAGMMPEVAGRFSSVTGDAVWQAYRAEFDRTWSHSETERFQAMRAWRDGELREALPGPCDTLFYPFSGPDIVNAWVLFPNCNRYVMFGLEHTGAFPNLEGMSPARVDRLLGDVRHVVADLFERNYFITKRMMSDLETPELEGTLPVLELLLARLGSTLTAVTPLELTPAGTLVAPGIRAAAGRANLPAVRIDSLSPTGMPQQILYFRMQADDAPLAKHPGVGLFLGSLRPYRTVDQERLVPDARTRVHPHTRRAPGGIVEHPAGRHGDSVRAPEHRRVGRAALRGVRETHQGIQLRGTARPRSGVRRAPAGAPSAVHVGVSLAERDLTGDPGHPAGDGPSQVTARPRRCASPSSPHPRGEKPVPERPLDVERQDHVRPEAVELRHVPIAERRVQRRPVLLRRDDDGRVIERARLRRAAPVADPRACGAGTTAAATARRGRRSP